VPIPFGKAPTWAYVLHALGEFGVSIEEFQLPKINGELSPTTFILKRVTKEKTYVFAGSFDRNERLLPSVVQAICRRLNLKYNTIFGK
jgi:hypothetical protein